MGKNGGWVKIIFNETFYEKYPISVLVARALVLGGTPGKVSTQARRTRSLIAHSLLLTLYLSIYK